jgi:hypothetical protein
MKYPETKILTNKEGTIESIPFKVSTLKNIIRTTEKNDKKQKPIVLQISEETKVLLDGLKLQNVFDMLRMKNDETFSFYYQPKNGFTIRPLHIELKDRYALLLPMRGLE